jgi:predicted nucleic acid-binding protein
MIISDTSVWIEFLKKKEPIFSKQRKLLEDQKSLALECIFGELLQGALNKRERTLITDYWNNLPKIEEKGLWIRAGYYAGEQKLFAKGVGLIDAFIYVAADLYKARVWTLDAKLKAILPAEMIFDTFLGDL